MRNMKFQTMKKYENIKNQSIKIQVSSNFEFQKSETSSVFKCNSVRAGKQQIEISKKSIRINKLGARKSNMKKKKECLSQFNHNYLSYSFHFLISFSHCNEN